MMSTGGEDAPATPTTNKSAEKKLAADASTPTSGKANKGSGGKSKTPKTPGTPTSSRASKLKAKKVTDAIDGASGGSKTPTGPKPNPLGAWLAMKSPKAAVVTPSDAAVALAEITAAAGESETAAEPPVNIEVKEGPTPAQNTMDNSSKSENPPPAPDSAAVVEAKDSSSS